MQENVLYTRRFFQVFIAVVLFMTGAALQFHFGEYMQHLGYSEEILGRALALSMVGTILIRLHIGRWIDRFGCRPTWLVGALVVALAVGSMQFATSLGMIVVLRTAMTMAFSAAMTTVAVFAAQVAPPGRRAESIGTMGLAGFLGMVMGPALGDWIFSGSDNSMAPFHIFFSASAILSLLAAGTMMWIGFGASRINSTIENKPDIQTDEAAMSQLQALRRCWPGMILVVGVTFAIAFSWQTIFLERFAEAQRFQEIKVFFLVYSPTAILLRLIFRRLPQTLGRTRTVVLGLVLLGTGQLTLMGVDTQTQLILPGLLMGAGHCFIFPSMVDLGADPFPAAHRGTGTALILGAGDLGMLIGFFGLGTLIDAYGYDRALGVLAMITIGSAILLATRAAGLKRLRRREAGFERFRRPHSGIKRLGRRISSPPSRQCR